MPDRSAAIDQSVSVITTALKQDHKIWFCGNGGSAADAQHLAAELSGRFYFARDPLFAEALHVNTYYLTAVANDYGYDVVYSRLMKAKCRVGDVLVAGFDMKDLEKIGLIKFDILEVSAIWVNP